MSDNTVRLIKNSHRSWLPLIPLFVLVTLATSFISLRLGSSILGLSAATLLSSLIAYGLRDDSTNPKPSAKENCLSGASLAITLGFGFMIVTTYGSSYILPAHDPIAVPLLAKTILGGTLPLDAFPAGSSAHSYPPGYPMLFAPMLAVLPAADSLLLFKILNITTIAMIPASWAWMQQRIFPIAIPRWQVLGASYLAFFGIERTLGFALPFAGKNAVLLGVLLAPIVVVSMIRLAKARVRWALVAAPFFGLVLIHYTMLHMMAALIGSYIAIGLSIKHVTWREALRLALVGTLTLGLLLSFLHEALTDPRTGGFAFAPLEGIQHVFRTLVAKYSFMVIYGDQDFGVLKFPYRGLVLVFCTAAAVIVSYTIKAPNLRYAALWYFGAFVGTLAMALDVIPSALPVDFARWFLWAIQAAIFFIAIISLLQLVRCSVGFRRNIAILAFLLIGTVAFTMMLLDRRVYVGANEAQRVSRTELIEMQALLKSASAGGTCFIISDSIAIPDLLITIQKEKRWEYVEILTDCTYLNGSWMHPGVPGGRELAGLPSAAVLEPLIDHSAIIFAGSEQKLTEYTGKLRDRGMMLEARKLSGTKQLTVWSITVRRTANGSHKPLH